MSAKTKINPTMKRGSSVAMAKSKRSLPRSTSGLKVLMSSGIASIGLALWGAIVATLPGQFSSAVAFERSAPATASDSPVDYKAMETEILDTTAMKDVIRTTPAVECEPWGDKPELALQSRTAISFEAPNNGRQRIVVRVRCSNLEASERLGRAIVDRFLVGKPQPTKQPKRDRNLAQAEALCLTKAKALADARARLETLRQIEAKSTKSTAREELAQVQSDLQRASTATSEIERVAHETRADEQVETSGSETIVDDTLVHRALRDVYRQRAEVIATFTDKHPAVRSLDRKIQELAAAAGIADVDSWFKGSTAVEVVPFIRKSQVTDATVQRVNAIENTVDFLKRREWELTNKIASETARDAAIARQFEEVTKLQKAWHDALSSKRQILETSRMPTSDNVPEYRRCPSLLECGRCEGPNRGNWFCVGSIVWMAGCGLVGFGRRLRSPMK